MWRQTVYMPLQKLMLIALVSLQLLREMGVNRITAYALACTLRSFLAVATHTIDAVDTCFLDI